MSIRISIEFRSDESIFSGKAIDKDRLLRYVALALERENGETLTGPFEQGGSQVFQLTLDDSRQQWACRPSQQASSSDQD